MTLETQGLVRKIAKKNTNFFRALKYCDFMDASLTIRNYSEVLPSRVNASVQNVRILHERQFVCSNSTDIVQVNHNSKISSTYYARPKIPFSKHFQNNKPRISRLHYRAIIHKTNQGQSGEKSAGDLGLPLR